MILSTQEQKALSQRFDILALRYYMAGFSDNSSSQTVSSARFDEATIVLTLLGVKDISRDLTMRGRELYQAGVKEQNGRLIQEYTEIKDYEGGPFWF